MTGAKFCHYSTMYKGYAIDVEESYTSGEDNDSPARTAQLRQKRH